MTKKLLPTMIGAALIAGVSAASADVTVFGHLDLSMNSDDTDDTSITNDDLTMDCNTCSIGFKGSEDLGNGLKAIFKIDFQYDMDEVGGIVDRDQWVGLAGGFGKVRFGTISTGYKSHGAMIDPLYRTSLEGRGRGLQSRYHSGAGEEDHGRSINTVRWDSADFSGVKLVAHYQFDEGDLATDNDDTFGIGASYENGGILVFADYMDDQEDGANEDSAWKIGGKYTMNDFAVMGQYEQQDEGDAVGTEEETFWHIGASFTMGNNMLYAGYGQGESDGPGDGEYDAWTIAGTHSMSKRTKVYLGYTAADCDAGADDAHPVCGSTANPVVGDNERITLGMKHKF